MPAAVAIPLILGGASAATQLYGMKKAGDASKKAATVQNDAAKYASDLTAGATQQSLGLQRDMFNRGQQLVAPYVGLGRSAGSALSRMMGLPDGGDQMPMQAPANAGAFSPFMGQGQMVSLRAPDGSVKQVPAEQADFYVSQGAVRT